MIGINKSLYDHYLANTEKYEIYDQVLVQKFIGLGAGTENYDDRKTLAILLVQKIFEPHSKQMMGNYLETLAHVESRVKDLYYNARDHVIHAVITYFLGIYLSDLLSLKIDTFEWKLAALLHDIGYPIEQGFGRPVEAEINKFIESNEIDSPRVDFNRKLRNLERLAQSGFSGQAFRF